MERILDIYHDCDTFSLSLAKPITSVSTEAKAELINELLASEKQRMRERYDYFSDEEIFKSLPDYDTLFDEVFEETRAFYAQFEGKSVDELIKSKINPFICDHVGKDTKYHEPLNFFWHLYHNCQMVFMNADSLEKLPIDDEFAMQVFESDFNKPLKPHLKKVKYTYSSHCTIGPLQLVYYFTLNDETKTWLNQFETDYDLDKGDFEDLAIYKNDEIKFSSCTHEGFNSLDDERKNW